MLGLLGLTQEAMGPLPDVISSPACILFPSRTETTTSRKKDTPGRALSPPPHPITKSHLLGEVELGEANEVLYENGEAFSILQEGIPENQARAA